MKIHHSRTRPSPLAQMVRDHGVYVTTNELNRWTRLGLIKPPALVISQDQQQDYLDRIFVLGHIHQRQSQTGYVLHLIRLLMGRVDRSSHSALIANWYSGIRMLVVIPHMAGVPGWDTYFNEYRRAGWEQLGNHRSNVRAYDQGTALPRLNPEMCARSFSALSEWHSEVSRSVQEQNEHDIENGNLRQAFVMSNNFLDVKSTVERFNSFADLLTLEWLRSNYVEVITEEILFEIEHSSGDYLGLIFSIERRLHEIANQFFSTADMRGPVPE